MQRLCIFLAALAFAGSACAQDLRLTDAWVRWIPGGAPSGGYFTVHNDSNRPIELTGASSPDYGHVMMHRTTTEGGEARMEGVDKVTVPAHGEVRFAPRGYHLMMMQPGPGVKVGGEVTVELEFSGGRSLSARFPVRGPGG
jgi:copper(I)-binding protein